MKESVTIALSIGISFCSYFFWDALDGTDLPKPSKIASQAKGIASSETLTTEQEAYEERARQRGLERDRKQEEQRAQQQREQEATAERARKRALEEERRRELIESQKNDFLSSWKQQIRCTYKGGEWTPMLLGGGFDEVKIVFYNDSEHLINEARVRFWVKKRIDRHVCYNEEHTFRDIPPHGSQSVTISGTCGMRPPRIGITYVRVDKFSLDETISWEEAFSEDFH